MLFIDFVFLERKNYFSSAVNKNLKFYFYLSGFSVVPINLQSSNEAFKLKDESTVLLEETIGSIEKSLKTDESLTDDRKDDKIETVSLSMKSVDNDQSQTESKQTLDTSKQEAKVSTNQQDESILKSDSFHGKTQELVLSNESGECIFDSLFVDNFHVPKKIELV